MYNNYGYTVTRPEPTTVFAGLTGVAIVLLIFIVLIAIAIAVVVIVAQCKIYSKAGEKAWKALIPGYNTWILTKISGLAWWWFPITMGLSALANVGKSSNYVVLLLVFLVSYNYDYNIAKKFGKSSGFAVLLALLPFIGYPILGFGSAKYNKDANVDKNGIFAIEK